MTDPLDLIGSRPPQQPRPAGGVSVMPTPPAAAPVGQPVAPGAPPVLPAPSQAPPPQSQAPSQNPLDLIGQAPLAPVQNAGAWRPIETPAAPEAPALPGLENVDSSLARRVAQADAELRKLGIRLGVNSGFRSRAEQERLFRERPGVAAPPGKSNHEKGRAVDLRAEGSNIRDPRVQQVLRRYGLHAPIQREPWHWEVAPVGPPAPEKPLQGTALTPAQAERLDPLPPKPSREQVRGGLTYDPVHRRLTRPPTTGEKAGSLALGALGMRPFPEKAREAYLQLAETGQAPLPAMLSADKKQREAQLSNIKRLERKLDTYEREVRDWLNREEKKVGFRLGVPGSVKVQHQVSAEDQAKRQALYEQAAEKLAQAEDWLRKQGWTFSEIQAQALPSLVAGRILNLQAGAGLLDDLQAATFAGAAGEAAAGLLAPGIASRLAALARKPVAVGGKVVAGLGKSGVGRALVAGGRKAAQLASPRALESAVEGAVAGGIQQPATHKLIENPDAGAGELVGQAALGAAGGAALGSALDFIGHRVAGAADAALTRIPELGRQAAEALAPDAPPAVVAELRAPTKEAVTRLTREAVAQGQFVKAKLRPDGQGYDVQILADRPAAPVRAEVPVEAPAPRVEEAPPAEVAAEPPVRPEISPEPAPRAEVPEPPQTARQDAPAPVREAPAEAPDPEPWLMRREEFVSANRNWSPEQENPLNSPEQAESAYISRLVSAGKTRQTLRRYEGMDTIEADIPPGLELVMEGGPGRRRLSLVRPDGEDLEVLGIVHESRDGGVSHIALSPELRRQGVGGKLLAAAEAQGIDVGRAKQRSANYLKSLHRYRVERALAEGKPVPPEVLADYPDLAPAPAAPKPAPEAGTPPTAPAPTPPASAGTAPTLPRDLAGAKPRYSYGDKRFTLSFESDVDRALYIVGSDKTKSKRDAEYLEFLGRALPGKTEAELRALGGEVRSALKALAKDSDPGSLTLPDQGHFARDERVAMRSGIDVRDDSLAVNPLPGRPGTFRVSDLWSGDAHLGHDFRSPLSIVDAWGRTIQEGFYEKRGGVLGKQGSERIREAHRKIEQRLLRWNRALEGIEGDLDKAMAAAGIKGKRAKEKFFADFVDLIEMEKTDPARAGASPEMQAALDKHDELAEQFRQYIIASRRSLGDDVPDDWGVTETGYFRHLFLGDIRLFSRAPDGKEVIVGYAGTYAEAQRLALDYLKANPDAELTARARQTFSGDSTLRIRDKRYWKIVNDLAGEVKLSKKEIMDDLRGTIGRQGAKRKFLGALLKREGFAGYRKDYLEVMQIHAYQTARSQELTALNRDLTPIIDKLKEKDLPGVAEAMEAHLNDLWGKPTPLEVRFGRLIESTPHLRNHVANPHMALRGAARRITAVNTAIKLDANLKASTVNTLQPLTTLWPYTTTKEFVGLYADFAKRETRQMLRDKGILSGFGKLETESLSGLHRGLVDRLSPFRKASELNRGIGYLFGYRKALKEGLSEAQAHRNGLAWAEKVEFDNSVWNAPPVLRNPVGRVLGQFKGFTIKNLEHIGSLQRRQPGENRADVAKRLGKFGVAQLAIGGVKSVSLGGKAISTGGKVAAGYALVQYLSGQLQHYGMDAEDAQQTAEAVYYGAPSLIGQDLTMSVGVIDAPFGRTAEEQAFNFLAGPTGSAVAALANHGASLKTLQRLTPLARQGETAAQIAGEGRATVKGPDGPVALTPFEAVMRALGFVPLKQTRAFDRKEARQAGSQAGRSR